jgi:hypothetical protein
MNPQSAKKSSLYDQLLALPDGLTGVIHLADLWA